MVKGSLVVVILVFLAAILLNIIMLSEGFVTVPTNNKTCYRRLGDMCELKTIDGTVDCYDKNNKKCNANCCDTTAEVVVTDATLGANTTTDTTNPIATTNSPTDVSTNTKSAGDSIKALINAYKPTSTTPVDDSAATLDTAFDQLSPEAKASSMNKVRSILKSDVQKAVKDELLASRATNPVPPACPDANSPALQQGSCFRGASTDPSVPSSSSLPYGTGQQSCDSDSVKPLDPIDMSQYIRKDSIPCYGCTLPQ